MGMYLVTGQPGHGKTAYAIDKAFKWKNEGRSIYAHGIKDFDFDKAGFNYLEDPTKWQDLPDGSVILLDECYSVFPNRNPGARVPEHVEAMARHRHRGFDFIMIAQQGLQLDPFLRGLYEEHVHIRQTSIIKAKTKLKRWTQYQNNTAVKCMDTIDWMRPSYVFEYYTSTTKVTTRRSMPMWLRWLIAGAVFLVVLMIVIKWYFTSKIALYESDKPVASQEAGGAAPRGAQGAATPAERHYDTPSDYAKAHLPRFATMPWTAPVFDQRQVTVDPQLVCMSSNGGADVDGNHREPSCTCMTEQATLYEMSQPECRRIARFGPVYNPYRTQQTQPQAPPHAGAGASPPTAASPHGVPGVAISAPQMSG